MNNSKPPEQPKIISPPTLRAGDTYILLKFIKGPGMEPRMEVTASPDLGPFEVACALSQAVPISLQQYIQACQSIIQSPHGGPVLKHPKG